MFNTEICIFEFFSNAYEVCPADAGHTQHIYEMACLVQNRNYVHQRKLSAKKKHRFSKAATS